MNKRIFALLLALLVLCLAGCGQDGTTETTGDTTTASPETNAPEKLDMQAIYDGIADSVEMPEMLPLDEKMMLDYCGIQSADCVQAVVAICGDGLRTDEIWLIEAVDGAALARLKELAQARLQAKADESITYSPEQYAVVEKAQVLEHGNYLAVLVSPNVDAMAQLFRAASGT